MKKLILLLVLFIIISFGGCNNVDTASRNDVTINMPIDDTVNGYREEIVVEESDTIKENTHSTVENSKPEENKKIQYCANTNSKKFHMGDCASVKTISENNRLYLSDRDELISLGYEPCKRCNP